MGCRSLIIIAAGFAAFVTPAFAHSHGDKEVLTTDHMDGIATAINTNTIRVRGHKVELLGVTRPNTDDQEAKGTAFAKHLVDGQLVSCQITGKTPKGHLQGSCYIGDLDIGAAIISAGYSQP